MKRVFLVAILGLNILCSITQIKSQPTYEVIIKSALAASFLVGNLRTVLNNPAIAKHSLINGMALSCIWSLFTRFGVNFLANMRCIDIDFINHILKHRMSIHFIDTLAKASIIGLWVGDMKYIPKSIYTLEDFEEIFNRSKWFGVGIYCLYSAIRAHYDSKKDNNNNGNDNQINQNQVIQPFVGHGFNLAN